MKVIASSLRKGAVVDLDGKLYVVLTAENIHPGKGTPVTQLNMRRISDGVKVSEEPAETDRSESPLAATATVTLALGAEESAMPTVAEEPCDTVRMVGLTMIVGPSTVIAIG